MNEITVATLDKIIENIPQGTTLIPAGWAPIEPLVSVVFAPEAPSDFPLAPTIGKPEKPPKLGNFHFTPRKKQQVVKSVGSYKYIAATTFGQKSCKVVRRPGSWFTTHRCATHDVLIIWKSKDGIPWT